MADEGTWFEKYDEVVRLFEQGEVPSAIDFMLHLPEGTAHDVMVSEWRSRRLFSARMVRRG